MLFLEVVVLRKDSGDEFGTVFDCLVVTLLLKRYYKIRIYNSYGGRQ